MILLLRYCYKDLKNLVIEDFKRLFLIEIQEANIFYYGDLN